MTDHDCYRDNIIGVEVQGVYDGILIWRCGVCGKMWPRFNEGKRYRVAQELIEQWQAADELTRLTEEMGLYEDGAE